MASGIRRLEQSVSEIPSPACGRLDAMFNIPHYTIHYPYHEPSIILHVPGRLPYTNDSTLTGYSDGKYYRPKDINAGKID